MPLKINLKSVYLYATYLILSVLVNLAIDGVPLSIALLFSMLLCGTNLIITPLLFVAASAAHWNLTLFLLSLFEGAFLTLVTFLYRRQNKKIRLEAILYLLISLAPFVALGDFTGIGEELISGYLIRTIAAVFVIAFTLFSFKSLYAVMFRIYRCRLREDELLSLCIVFVGCGLGLLRLIGIGFYVASSFLVVVIFLRLLKSPAAIIPAVVIAIPLFIHTLSLEYITAFVVISIIALVFAHSGRYILPVVCFLLALGYMYLCGILATTMPLKILYICVLFLACFLASFPTESYLRRLARRLTLKGELTETAVRRTKRRISRKLFRISEVFREIERAFQALDENDDDDNSKQRILSELKLRHCSTCEKKDFCEKSRVYFALAHLIESGCIKGKVSIVDLPSEMTQGCIKTYEILASLNKILVDYKKFHQDAENTKSGRRLLSDQAHGIAMVLKECAVDLNGEVGENEDLSELIKDNLSAEGISCPELLIDGNESLTVLATTIGKSDIATMSRTISKCLSREFILKDKIEIDSLKRTYVFASPPYFDAVFGVAYAIKDNETVSGDTHSVIRLNEKSFLMVLSDGMGSGEKARGISDAAISLIEAYYRADMPKDTVLRTVNKLLSFNRDERFTCIDIAAISLETGRADFVKIGSPVAVILRENELKVLESSSLPLGILDTLKPTVCTETLENNDTLIFMSDGISSAFASPDDMYRTFESLVTLNPQNVADEILSAAKNRTQGKCLDDMTVLVTRIFKR